MRRTRSAKIVATLGPATSDAKVIRALFERGVDVFRLNFSHGTQFDHAQRLDTLRGLEKEFGRPIGVLLDLQGPKLRLGTFNGGKAQLDAGARFRLDMDPASGDASRAPLLHPEIFAALQPGTELLLDDGKLRLRVERYGTDFAETTVIVGGPISDRKGVNVPSVVLPLSPLTAKDRDDLDFGLSMGVDWVALSFVQRPEDIEEARAIIGSRAWIMAKLEKPAAIEHLDAIVALCDGIMVARGDLGVELPPEQVPEMQRLIVRACRRGGKPVVVATQRLESMIASPVPTRAEVSDVATAIYDGVDAVMLSAESASGKYPLEAVEIDGTNHHPGRNQSLVPRWNRCHACPGAVHHCRRGLLDAAPHGIPALACRHRHLHVLGLHEPARGARAACGPHPGADALDCHGAPDGHGVGRACGAGRQRPRCQRDDRAREPHRAHRRIRQAWRRCSDRRRLAVRTFGNDEPVARRAHRELKG